MNRPKKSPAQSLLERVPTLALIVGAAAAVAFAISQEGAGYLGLPVVIWCALIAFVIQWLAYIPAFIQKNERFFDLTGSLTYLTLCGTALVMVGRFDQRSILLTVLIAVWALRLGTFLFRRIHREGKDGRFDKMKHDAGAFLIVWTLQGLWVFLTMAASLAAITAPKDTPLGIAAAVGLAAWIAGFAIEVVADQQKAVFRRSPENAGKFIDSGLWSWSRHPNYFGEILLWAGAAIIALPTLDGWRYVALISPLFVFFLLTRISGVPLLEKRADKRWGGNEDYERYKRRTSVLVPLPPSG